MLKHHRKQRVDIGIGLLLAGVQPVHHLRQKPWSAIGSAPDHHPVRARLLQRAARIVNRADIAVDDHRDTDGVFDRADKRPVRFAAIHLVAGAAMDRDHFCAEVFGNMRQFRSIQAVMAPAHPHLDRHRDSDCLDRRRDQRGGQRQIAHQGGTGIAVDHLFHRATHVDIDDRRAAVLLELGRLAHLCGIAADQLHRYGLLNRVPLRLLQRLAGFADRCRAGDHLGYVEPRAKPAHQAAERQIGYAGHRREDYRTVDPHRSDINRGEARRDGKRVHRYLPKIWAAHRQLPRRRQAFTGDRP